MPNHSSSVQTRFETLFQRTEDFAKAIKDLKIFLKKRFELDEIYARGLLKLAKDAGARKTLFQSAFGDLWATLLSSTEEEGAAQMALLASLLQSVIEQLNSVQKDELEASLEKMQLQVRAAAADIQSSNSESLKAKLRYESAAKDYEQVLLQIIQMNGGACEDWYVPDAKLAEREATMAKRVSLLEESFLAGVRNGSEKQALLFSQLAKFNEELEILCESSTSRVHSILDSFVEKISAASPSPLMFPGFTEQLQACVRSIRPMDYVRSVLCNESAELAGPAQHPVASNVEKFEQYTYTDQVYLLLSKKTQYEFVMAGVKEDGVDWAAQQQLIYENSADKDMRPSRSGSVSSAQQEMRSSRSGSMSAPKRSIPSPTSSTASSATSSFTDTTPASPVAPPRALNRRPSEPVNASSNPPAPERPAVLQPKQAQSPSSPPVMDTRKMNTLPRNFQLSSARPPVSGLSSAPAANPTKTPSRPPPPLRPSGASGIQRASSEEQVNSASSRWGGSAENIQATSGGSAGSSSEKLESPIYAQPWQFVADEFAPPSRPPPPAIGQSHNPPPPPPRGAGSVNVRAFPKSPSMNSLPASSAATGSSNSSSSSSSSSSGASPSSGGKLTPTRVVPAIPPSASAPAGMLPSPGADKKVSGEVGSAMARIMERRRQTPTNTSPTASFTFSSAHVEKEKSASQRPIVHSEQDEDAFQRQGSDDFDEQQEEFGGTDASYDPASSADTDLSWGAARGGDSHDQTLQGAYANGLTAYRSSVTLPPLVEQSLQYLEQWGLQEEGLFRVPGDVTKIKSLKQQFDAAARVDLSQELDPSTIAGLLKLWLRETRDPPIPKHYTRELSAIISDTTDERVKLDRVRAIIEGLPLLNRELLACLTHLFVKVSNNAATNKMTLDALARSVGLSLFNGASVNFSISMLKLLVQNCHELFPFNE